MPSVSAAARSRREARGPRTRTRAKSRCVASSPEIRDERVAERVRIARLDQNAGVANDLLDRAGAIADDRRAGGERLERRQAEPLEQRGVEETLRPGVQRRERRFTRRGPQDDAIARRAPASSAL